MKVLAPFTDSGTGMEFKEEVTLCRSIKYVKKDGGPVQMYFRVKLSEEKFRLFRPNEIVHSYHWVHVDNLTIIEEEVYYCDN